MVKKIESVLAWGGAKKDIALLVVSALSLVASLLAGGSIVPDPAWIAILCCGIPIIVGAAVALVTELDITADLLVSIAIIASVFVGELFAAGEVALIMQLGSLLEDLTAARARAGIERLVNLTPTVARVLREGEELLVGAEEVLVGDTVRVLPGETIPVDGVITSGSTSVNQAIMTGESLPVDKSVGDEVSSGTVNQFGSFDMRATHVGEDSSFRRMIQLVESADADKAKIVRLADRWAVWVVLGSLSIAILTWIFTHEIIRAVTVLVVFCPCSLVLATPTAIMAGIGNATKHGFLVKEGDALERLEKVEKVVFDKTGTLTEGAPELVHVQCESKALSCDELLALAATAELKSEHPLAHAVVAGARGIIAEPDSFEMVPGKGVHAFAAGHEVLSGNLSFLAEHGVKLNAEQLTAAEGYAQHGCALMYLAVDGAYAGFLALADTQRAAAAPMVSALSAEGVVPVLLSGDSAAAANTIAQQIGIHEVVAGCLPEDKLNYVNRVESTDTRVCMVGDGVNDAPALRRAYVGIAMGGIGSDIAVDAADIALIDDAIDELPHLLALSKRMMRTIRLNLTFSMGLNFVAVTLAAIGVLNPVIGALVHNAGSVAVVMNSARLLAWRRQGSIYEDCEQADECKDCPNFEICHPDRVQRDQALAA